MALYEAVFALMVSLVPEYDAHDIIRQRSGNLLPGIAPTNIYPCLEGNWVIIGGNADGIFKRLMHAIGRADLADDPRFQHNPGRWEHHEFLDQIIGEWTAQRSIDEVMAVMVEAGVPAGALYDAPAIVDDPHFEAREMLETHQVAIGDDAPKPVRFPGIVPKLSETPGGTQWLGPELGAHNEEIYGGLLGLPPHEIEWLKQTRVI